MSEVTLQARTGRTLGSSSSRRLRREGQVPAVVYGLGQEPLTVSVDQVALRRALTTDAGLNALITLDIEGARQLSIVKDLQRHPVRRDVLHVDFIRLDADALITVEVPLEFVGEARKVTQADGMVDHPMHALSITARPDAIPTGLTVDVSELDLGENIRVVDLELPSGVELAEGVDPEAAVAVGMITRSTIAAMQEDAAAEAAEEAEGEGDGEGEAEGDSGDDAGDSED